MVANFVSSHERSAGFAAPISGDDARRQLRMSAGVVVVIAIGIVSAAVTIGSHPIAARRDVLSDVPVKTLHAHLNSVAGKPI